MVLTIDDDSKKIRATILNNSCLEEYECVLFFCDNPVCACGVANMKLIKRQGQQPDDSTTQHRVDVDILLKELQIEHGLKKTKEEMAFSNLFLSQLGDADYQLLWDHYFSYKNEITEKADIQSIDAHFDYAGIERNGDLYAFNEVLPFGEQIFVNISNKETVIVDYFCLLPKCSCSDTTLRVLTQEAFGKEGKELCCITLNYEKRRWGEAEGPSAFIALSDVRSAIEEQIPDFYSKIAQRHAKLKRIYAHCKKQYHSQKQSVATSRISRNDPCPCGSGKKYKKCCLQNSS